MMRLTLAFDTGGYLARAKPDVYHPHVKVRVGANVGLAQHIHTRAWELWVSDHQGATRIDTSPRVNKTLPGLLAYYTHVEVIE